MFGVQDAFHGIFANFPIRPVAWTMQALTFPAGESYSRPSDKLMTQVRSSHIPPSPHRGPDRSMRCVSIDPCRCLT